MVQPATKVTTAQAGQYVPVSFSCPGQKTITIEFPKGTHVDKDPEKGKGHGFTFTRPAGITVDKAHYEAIKHADANGDHRIDKKDAEALKGKIKNGATATSPYYIKSKQGKASFGILLAGGAAYNQAHSAGD